MSSSLAFVLFTGLVIALLLTTRKTAGVSAASWLAVVWTSIGSSRPITTWFSSGSDGGEGAESYDAGNPVERNFYLFLIFAAVVILFRRRASLKAYLANNTAFCLLVVFWGLSTIWSDYPVITFKRWIKDAGTILIVLTVLTELNPAEAIKLLFVRCAYILVPYSILLIRYSGDLGRIYSQWSGEMMYVGVTTHKNMLGMAALTSILFLVWSIAAKLKSLGWFRLLRHALPELLILGAAIHLLYVSHSATSLVCTGIGLVIYLILKLPFFHNNLVRTRTLVVTFFLILLATNIFIDIKAEFLNLVGRDPTLTTRTEVWPILLKEQTSPVLGPGFKAFWAGTRLVHLWNDYSIIQAHNGYLETYLNGGFVALFLLAGFLLASLKRINSSLTPFDDFGYLRIAIWTVAVIHNWTEASFNSPSPLWVAFIAVATEYPRFVVEEPYSSNRISKDSALFK